MRLSEYKKVGSVDKYERRNTPAGNVVKWIFLILFFWWYIAFADWFYEMVGPPARYDGPPN